MKVLKFLVYSLLLFSLGCKIISLPDNAEAEKLQPVKKNVIVLSPDNTYVLRGVITQDSIAKATNEMILLSQRLNPNAVIYLVLDTPGGDVNAGNRFIDAMKALPQKITTITIFSASMGFQIVQNMDERLITPTGTLMSHRASVSGMGGPVPGSLLVEINHLLKILERLDLTAATRMGEDLKSYREQIRDEYWVSGEDAVNDKAADKVVLIRCAPSLMGTVDTLVESPFGTMKVTFSKCPAISAPLAVDISQMKFDTKESKNEFLKYENELFYNKTAFVHDYIGR